VASAQKGSNIDLLHLLEGQPAFSRKDAEIKT